MSFGVIVLQRKGHREHIFTIRTHFVKMNLSCKTSSWIHLFPFNLSYIIHRSDSKAQYFANIKHRVLRHYWAIYMILCTNTVGSTKHLHWHHNFILSHVAKQISTFDIQWFSHQKQLQTSSTNQWSTCHHF